MLYAFRDENSLYLTAGDNLEQYNIFVEGVGYQLQGEAPDFLEKLTNELLAGLEQVFRIEFASEKELFEAAENYGIAVEHRNLAVEKQTKMLILAEEEADRQENEEYGEDRRTIGQIYGLDKNDPWAAKREGADAASINLLTSARQDGMISSESFDPKTRDDGNPTILGVNSSISVNGNISINGVTVKKNTAPVQLKPGDFIFAVVDTKIDAENPETGVVSKETVVVLDTKYRKNTPAEKYNTSDLMSKMNGIIPEDMWGFTPDFVEDARYGVTTQFPLFNAPVSLGQKYKNAHDVYPNFFAYSGFNPDEVRATLVSLGFVEDKNLLADLKNDTPYSYFDVSIPPNPAQAIPNPKIRAWVVAGQGQEEELRYTITFDKVARQFVEEAIEACGLKKGKYDLSTTADELTTTDCFFAVGLLYAIEDITKTQATVFPALPSDDAIRIDAPAAIAMMYRLDTNIPLLDAYKVLKAAKVDIDKWSMVRGFRTDCNGSYFICAVERLALQIEARLQPSVMLFSSEIYTINHSGDRVDAATAGNVEVDPIDEIAIGPRPWNADAHLLPLMAENERNEVMRSIRSKEFVFAGSTSPMTGMTTIYIQPVDYFREHGDFFNAETLPVRGLPSYLKEVEPGVYETKYHTYQKVSVTLGQLGMDESMSLRLWLNNQ